MSIETRILNCMEISGIDVSDYKKNNNDDFLIKLGLTSIEFVSLIVILEDEFNVEFPAEVLDISIISSFECLKKIVLEVLSNS